MSHNKKNVKQKPVREVVETAYSKDDARDTLKRIIEFVGNCDTKASVILGIFGIMLTIIITDSTISKLYTIVKAASDSATFHSIIFLILIILSMFVLLIGLVLIISVLLARVNNSQNDSKIYFVDIASNIDCNIYKRKLMKQTDADEIQDLINQIYINSKICTKKYKRYNIGVVLALTGIGLITVLFIMGVLVYI